MLPPRVVLVHDRVHAHMSGIQHVSKSPGRRVRDDVGIVVNNGGGKVFILFAMTVVWGVVKGGKTMNQDGV